MQRDKITATTQMLWCTDCIQVSIVNRLSFIRSCWICFQNLIQAWILGFVLLLPSLTEIYFHFDLILTPQGDNRAKSLLPAKMHLLLALISLTSAAIQIKILIPSLGSANTRRCALHSTQRPCSCWPRSKCSREWSPTSSRTNHAD